MIIGKIREIWRYPVKSMGGEKLQISSVGQIGIFGDRGWALRDEKAREIRGAKHMPSLLQCSAKYREPPNGEKIPHVDITLPDGTQIGSDDREVNSCLSQLLGRQVSLWPLQPADNRSHYKRAQFGGSIMNRISRSRIFRPMLKSLITHSHLQTSVREFFSREPGEPIPDVTTFPELMEFTSPPGTYFDAFPIHLLTTSSLATMSRYNPNAIWDVRRFRPNFLIETENCVEGLVEADWSGRTLHFGEISLKCEMPTVRCGMTMHAQAELPKDPSVLRTIVRDAEQNLGIYASVTRLGSASVGCGVKLRGKR
ncbi:MAG: MOSC domain-containing protein [Pyrinomonadaceae bacterium]